MMLKAAIVLLAIVSIAAAGLYWDRGRIAQKLEITEARLQAAENDAATKAETLAVLQSHNQLTASIERQRDALEITVRSSEGYNDEVPSIILDTISVLGLR